MLFVEGDVIIHTFQFIDLLLLVEICRSLCYLQLPQSHPHMA